MITSRLGAYRKNGTPGDSPELQNTRKRRAQLAFSILGMGLAAMAAAFVPGNRKLPPPVHAQVISPVAQPQRISASGRMRPAREVKISPEVSGEIIELPVREGQQVKKGDLLLRIKPDFYVANRDQAEGNYKSTVACIDIATARLHEAEVDLKRNQDLYRNKLVSASSFEEVKAACDVARAQLGNAQGQLEMARASLARAQYELDKTTIASPITGTIARLNSQVGERVVGTATMAGTEVMTLADLDDMEARVEVGEQDIRSLACGQTAQLEMNAFPEHTFEGTIIEIATSSAGFDAPGKIGGVDVAKFEVRIRLRKTQFFRPGMSVRAHIPISSGAPALARRAASVKASG